MGLQGKKLSSILTKAIRFKSITIGNCSLQLIEEDMKEFKEGFNLKLSSELEKSIESFSNHLDQINESSNEPKRKKLKDDSYDKINETDDKIIKKLNDKSIEQFVLNSDSKLNSKSNLIELIKPDFYFDKNFINEMFIRKDNKKSQDKSIVYFLDPIDEKYEIECINDGRRMGSTKKNYEKLVLKLSPQNLNTLIKKQLDRRAINLDNDEIVKIYDSLWTQLKKQIPNFVRWN